MPHVLHVHLQRSEEHDIVYAHLSKQLETCVAIEHMESVGANEQSCEYETCNRGYAQALKHHRSYEDDAEDDEENPRWV